MEDITINDRDRSISYSGTGWLTGSSGTSHGTATVGDFATYVFRGSSISVFGRISGGLVERGATSLYEIDGESQGSIYRAQPRLETTLIDQVFYTSPPLDPAKEHTLVITVIATGGNALWIDYLKIVPANGANIPGPSPTQSQTTSPSPQTTSTTALVKVVYSSTTSVSTIVSSSLSIVQLPSTTPVSTTLSSLQLTQLASTATQIETPTHSANTASGGLSRNAIVGIVVGTVVDSLLIAICLFYFIRYRGKRKAQVQSRREAAFVQSVGHQSVPSSLNVTSDSTSFEGGYQPQNGYVVCGGSLIENMHGHLAPIERGSRGSLSV